MSKNKRKVGLVGCGAIGEGVARFIDKKLKDTACFYAISDLDFDRANKLQKKLTSKPKVIDVDKLIDQVDLVVEAASVEAARYILKRAVKKKKDVVVLSVGALIEEPQVIKEAEKRDVIIHIPSGAIAGSDGLGSLSLGNIKRISLTTFKPPQGLIGADYLKKKRIDINKIKKETVIFQGSVKQAIKYFPKNINVAATLFLAASQGDVRVCIKTDPRLKRNIHRIDIDANEAKVSVEVENVPSKLNPKTSALAILSTQYVLKKIFSSLKVGG